MITNNAGRINVTIAHPVAIGNVLLNKHQMVYPIMNAWGKMMDTQISKIIVNRIAFFILVFLDDSEYAMFFKE